MPPSRDRRVVRLDTDAIRQRELKAYKRAEKKVESLRRELDTFRQFDVPQFRIWLHREFGAELTEHRRIQQELDDKRGLLSDVEDVGRRFGLSEAAAYRKVLIRRANPEAAEAEDRAWEERQQQRHREAEADESGGEEQDRPFYDDCDDPFGEDAADAAFEALFEEMTGFRLPRGAREDRTPEAADDMGLKEAYRAVVQRLHPDRAESFGAVEQALWHEAQSAYKGGDLHALRRVLAHCEEGASMVGAASPVSLIRRLIADLRGRAHALRDELSDASEDPAWGFKKKGHTPAFRAHVKRGLESARHQLSFMLRQVNEMIAELDRQPRPPKPRRRRKRPAPAGEELELPF